MPKIESKIVDLDDLEKLLFNSIAELVTARSNIEDLRSEGIKYAAMGYAPSIERLQAATRNLLKATANTLANFDPQAQADLDRYLYSTNLSEFKNINAAALADVLKNTLSSSKNKAAIKKKLEGVETYHTKTRREKVRTDLVPLLGMDRRPDLVEGKYAEFNRVTPELQAGCDLKRHDKITHLLKRSRGGKRLDNHVDLIADLIRRYDVFGIEHNLRTLRSLKEAGKVLLSDIVMLEKEFEFEVDNRERFELLGIPGIGKTKLKKLVEVLDEFDVKVNDKHGGLILTIRG